ncbi:MAG: nitroreductase family protein [Candidatus Electryonea clarkiae]|nr:nitroreductase family protein [Candidatus Electryonea clarkiae]MDP8288949.1 nitroreductase family protein [Candidatus Electryonea clarkiae]
MDFNDFSKLVTETRSTRRFRTETRVSLPVLQELVSLARQTSSARNLQPLKYILVSVHDVCNQVFSCLGWAAALKDWDGPNESERPSGYIVILGDKNLHRDIDCDHGISAQTMMLGARSMGLGCCMMGSIKRSQLRVALEIKEQFDILLILAIGEPGEKVVIETMPENDDFNYWWDDNEVHHVPKRDLDELILKEF